MSQTAPNVGGVKEGGGEEERGGPQLPVPFPRQSGFVNKAPPLFVLCKGCPITGGELRRPGGVVYVDDEEVEIRTGRVLTCCAVCKGKAVDSASGMCFVCGRVQVMQTCTLCIECKRRAPALRALRPKPEDFYCDMEASDMCSEGGFIAQVGRRVLLDVIF